MACRSRDGFYTRAAGGLVEGEQGRRGGGGRRDGGVGRGSQLPAAARLGSQNSHDDISQWHLCWLCDTVA